jgi:phosphatidylinositol alpha 1,6-mannosyltransferase
MRVAIITESFPPDVNGVANTVLRVAQQLVGKGHHPLVIAPRPPRGTRQVGPFPYPVVAVYQTDLPAYARAYRLGRAGEATAWNWLRRIHNGTGRTLAPSTVTATGLLAHGMVNVWLWGRGVDTERFDPAKRSERLRAELAPGNELIAGYVGRLATEKRVEHLAGISGLPGVRLVVVGAGPAETALRQQLPGARFLGERRGEELAALYASMDVFVHSGPYETFGQTLQEAAASGLPVIAPAAGGPLDLVDDGATGYLVPPGEPDAFTAMVARLAADPAIRAEFGAAGRRKVLGRTWSALTDELLGHYAAVLGAPAPRTSRVRV